MRKLFMTFIPILVLILFTGCTSTDPSILLRQRVVERRDSFFLGECAKYYTTFVCGVREEPYLSDGQIGEMTPFGIITFQDKNNNTLGLDSINYYIMLDNIEYEGILEKSPYNNTYSADVERLTESGEEISVRLFSGAFEFQCKLTCVSADFKTSQSEAMSITAKALSSCITSMTSKKTLNAEVYIKIWKDYSGDEHAYFWYIGIVGNSHNCAILINTQTGNIVSIKK